MRIRGTGPGILLAHEAKGQVRGRRITIEVGQGVADHFRRNGRTDARPGDAVEANSLDAGGRLAIGFDLDPADIDAVAGAVLAGAGGFGTEDGCLRRGFRGLKIGLGTVASVD